LWLISAAFVPGEVSAAGAGLPIFTKVDGVQSVDFRITRAESKNVPGEFWPGLSSPTKAAWMHLLGKLLRNQLGRLMKLSFAPQSNEITGLSLRIGCARLG